MDVSFLNFIQQFSFQKNISSVLVLEDVDMSFDQIRKLNDMFSNVFIVKDNYFDNRSLSFRMKDFHSIKVLTSFEIRKISVELVITSFLTSDIYFILETLKNVRYFITMEKINDFPQSSRLLKENNHVLRVIPKFIFNSPLQETDQTSQEINQPAPSIIEESLKKISKKENPKDDQSKIEEKQVLLKIQDNKMSLTPNENFVSFFAVNYNTSKLINLLIKSIHKYVESFKYDIWIFDNSDKEKLILEDNWEDVHILDNTTGQLINYKEELKKYTDVDRYSKKFRNFISLKHALAIQFGLDNDDINDNFILCDSDVILIHDIDFIDNAYATIGTFEEKTGDFVRLSPYLCYINKKVLRDNDVSYFNKNFMHGCIDESGKVVNAYDTGTYFLKRCKELSLKVKEVNIYDYCIHFKAQSRDDDAAHKGNFDIDETARSYGLLKSLERYSFFIVNYNTSDLINLLIESIRKYVKSINYDIWIFDNSDNEKLLLSEENKNNVHVLDNTNGQIINYRKQIDRYCAVEYRKKKPSSFGLGEFPSARHAIAIQYIIDNAENLGMSEEIILCDSDIIIFKDLDFLKPNMLYQGFETHFEDSRTSDDRIKPCLCHVNSRIMNERKIRFFDPNKMLGCFDKNGGVIKKFDTGSSFYYAAHNYIDTQHIDIFKYCYHLIAQSHKERGKHNIETLHKDFIENTYPPFKLNRFDFTSNIDKIYFTISERYGIKDPKAKNVIYMCITGGYDEIHEQEYYDFENFDYVCFTNSDNLTSNKWRIVNISGIEKLLNLNDQTKLARFVKTHPHLFLKNYSRSIWIDGNIKIIEKNLADNFLPLLDEGNYFFVSEHPYIDNVYAEIDRCLELKKDTVKELERIRSFLMNEKFNDKGQHTQTNIILRNHNHIECIAIMEKWWQMIRDFSRRDQTSFNYAFQKLNGRFLSIPWTVMSSKFFNICSFHKKRVKY